ncbi:MAG: hypothetical protein HYU80_01605 [Candidatus Blackburnbacteria bacterium]|nr:hypothetical protein [Candidatus Blackburnbacteria bacterium]
MLKEFEQAIARRQFITQRLVETISLVAPAWVLTRQNTPEITSPVNLELEINEQGWQEAIAQKAGWEFLPDASYKKNLSCAPWHKRVCLGKISNNLKIAVNRPIAQFILKQAGVENLPVPYNIVFVDHWETVQTEAGHQAGFTAVTADGKEQNTILWLKYLAWYAFKQIDYHKLTPLEDYFAGVASYHLSVWAVHELGHAGKELKKFWNIRNTITPQVYELVHPQIHEFHNQYVKLLEVAQSQNRIRESLLFGIEPTVNLTKWREELYQEAENLGFKFAENP